MIQRFVILNHLQRLLPDKITVIPNTMSGATAAITITGVTGLLIRAFGNPSKNKVNYKGK